MISSLLCASSVCDKNGNHTDNNRFLLQMNHKAMDKTLTEATFPEGFEDHMQTSGEYKLKQQKASYLKCPIVRLCRAPKL